MEIYTNSSNRTVYIDLPIVPDNENAINIEVKEGTTVRYTTTGSFDEDTGRYSFVLPFNFAQSDREFCVNWQFVYTEGAETYEYDQQTDLQVVTPILTPEEIRSILDDPDLNYTASDAEVAKIERAVRFVIQAHTGQFFGKFVGIKSITGSGDTHLRMPMRLISVTSVNANTYWNESLALRGSGWYLSSKVWGVPSIRADLEGWHENPWTSPAPIWAPSRKTLHNFIENVEYEIDGIWGWNQVPQAVKEAAKLLVNDYACGDNAYRDRFLTSMTAADWRIQFHDGAFSNTGNVRANQLLAEFVLRRGWVVI